MIVKSGSDGYSGIDDHHTESRNEEHATTSESLNDKRRSDSNEPSPNTETSVDFKLSFLICNADLSEDFGQIVGDDGIAGPLREETEGDEDDETVAISLGLEEFKDGIVSIFLFEGKGSLDLTVDKLDGDIVLIVERKVVSEDLETAIGAVLLDVPTGRLRNEPDTDELDRSENTLKERGQSPGPGALQVLDSAEGSPSGNDVTDEPSCVVKSGEAGTVLRVGQLSNKKRRAALSHLDTETNQETSGGQHAEIDSCGLESNRNETALVSKISTEKHT